MHHNIRANFLYVQTYLAIILFSDSNSKWSRRSNTCRLQTEVMPRKTEESVASGCCGSDCSPEVLTWSKGFSAAQVQPTTQVTDANGFVVIYLLAKTTSIFTFRGF